MKNEMIANNNVILNLIQDLSSFIKAVRFQIKFGMTFLYNNSGFTLMELLVVVIIIAILAAVAVPQYKKAVLKSRFSTLMPLAKSLAKSNEVYYLNNGEYADNLSKLDVTFVPEPTEGVSAQVKSNERYNYVLAKHEGLNNNYIVYQSHSKNFPDNIHCEAKTDDTDANGMCTTLGGTKIGGSQTDGYTTYILQGNNADGHLSTTYKNRNNITLYEGDKCIATEWAQCTRNTYTQGSECVGKALATCRAGTIFDNSTCTAAYGATCAYAAFKNNSQCTATHKDGDECSTGNSFTDSTCWAKNGSWSCSGNTFKNSECIADTTQSCSNDKSGGKSSFDNSTCYGNAGTTCSNAKFTNNSTCVMKNDTACQGNTYSTGAGCQAKEGYTCPTGTPKVNSWDNTNNTYTSDGWHGGCCNPAYMVSGECPANATVCPAA